MRSWLLVLLTTLALTTAGQACTCVTAQSACELAKSETIFAGKVIAASKGEFSTAFLFEITQPFRGVLGGRVEVSTANWGSMCGYEFQVGVEYLVYAGGSGPLQTSICSGNKVLAEAATDLRYLRRLGRRSSTPDPPPGYVSGRVANRQADLYSLFRDPTWPEPGIRILARSASGPEVEAITGADGNYEFIDLPAGPYEIAVADSRYRATADTRVNVQAGSCSAVSFLNVKRAVLEGRILEWDGEPDGSSTLVLVPEGAEPSTPRPGDDNELETDADDDGTFRFEVPPGRYKLMVQPLGEDEAIPYSEVLTLDEHRAEKIEFRLPKRPLQLIEGVVIGAGEKAPAATIHLSGEAANGVSVFGTVELDDGARFSFEALPGDYELWAEADGCTGPRVLVKRGQSTPAQVPYPQRRDGVCPATTPAAKTPPGSAARHESPEPQKRAAPPALKSDTPPR